MKIFDALNLKIDHFLSANGILMNQKKKITEFEKQLSEFIQELLINLGASITLEAAIKMTILSQSNDERLMHLLRQSNNAIEGLNLFAKECDQKEVWRLVRLVNQLHLTGSSTSLFALEKFHDELWQQKLVFMRKKSEIITVQLTFLLMLSLISVIIVVISPIMLML